MVSVFKYSAIQRPKDNEYPLLVFRPVFCMQISSDTLSKVLHIVDDQTYLQLGYLHFYTEKCYF